MDWKKSLFFETKSIFQPLLEPHLKQVAHFEWINLNDRIWPPNCFVSILTLKCDPIFWVNFVTETCFGLKFPINYPAAMQRARARQNEHAGETNEATIRRNVYLFDASRCK